MSRKKYALVGTGGRGIGNFAVPIVQDYSEVAELVALCDVNPKRLEVALERIGTSVPVFTDFDEMLDSVACDSVIVTTTDATHHIFIEKALARGKDVITEKPMTVDDEKCRVILDAEADSSGEVTVTFNYRYAPYMTRIKELISSGAIGDVLSIDFSWYLDTIHGADYFRRWHRQKANSGGLMVHKATHHFDLVNWWIDSEPEAVFATGATRYYGPTRQERGERCRTCDYTETCPFFMDIEQNESMRKLYLQAEGEDGYWRDRCVFSPDIDIEDTMNAMVTYKNGVQMNYSLNAYSPFEGFRIAFNGSEGRLEAGEIGRVIQQTDTNFAGRREKARRIDMWAMNWDEETPPHEVIRVYPNFGGIEEHVVQRARGGHGGGDVRLHDMLFVPDQPDPLGHSAGSRAGAMSILVGVAANRSMRERRLVTIEELLNP